MTQILIALGVLGGLGLLFGAILGYASHIFHVEIDDRVEAVSALLPGANCGGCGYAGCTNFASEVVEGNAKPDGCPANSSQNAIAIGEIMGVEVSSHCRMVANVMCKGCTGVAEEKYQYCGVNDCYAANKLGGGAKVCNYACLGLGSCLKACKFDAITIKDGIAVVDHERCTACGMCIAACPKHAIVFVPYAASTIVECNSKDKGNVVSKACRVGCIACKLCIKACEPGAIEIIDNLAVVDYNKCINCGACVQKCPRECIQQFALS